MDVEFKLFGSLTAKQFGYILGGGVLALLSYFTFKALGSMLLAWIFVFLCVMLGLSLALIRINDQPFEVWLGNFFAAMFTSQKRVWKKEKKPLADTKQALPPRVEAPVQTVQPSAPQTRSDIKEPSIPQHPFKALNQSGQQPGSNLQSSAGMNSNNSITEHPDATSKTIAGNAAQGDFHYIPGTAQGAVKITSNQQPNRPISISSSGLSKQSAFLHSDVGQDAMSDNPGTSQNVNPASDAVGQDQGSNDSSPQQQFPSQGVDPQMMPQVQSPAPSQQGSSSDDFSHTNKAMQYGDVVPPKTTTLQSVTEDRGITSPTSQPGPAETDFEEENKALRQKIVEYSEDKEKLEKELNQTRSMYDELKNKNEEFMQQMKELREEFTKLQEKAESKTSLPPLPTRPAPGGEEKEEGGSLAPRVYNGPYLTKKPNVISGIVRSKDGNLIAGVVVIVKNDKNRPVRAMKTNSLGQFVTTTALENGVYTLELSKKEYTFGRYEVKLTGEIVPTYEFIAE
jgi:hypothetical protein